MKHLLRSLLLLAALAAAAAGAEAPVRILLTTGGHGFQEAELYRLFDALPGVTYTPAPLPASADLLKPGLEKTCDALVMYDMVADITPAQRAAFTNLLGLGLGVVSLHHNLGAHRTWPEFRRIVGGKWVAKAESIDGRSYPPSTYSHGEEMHIAVADREHPITRGLADFVIRDETYGGIYVAPEARVLLTTDHPKSSPPILWTTRYGRSRVVYLQSGHDNAAWTNAAFSTLLTRAILWSAHRLD